MNTADKGKLAYIGAKPGENRDVDADVRAKFEPWYGRALLEGDEG